MTKVLLAGFDRFGGLATNPSGIVVQRIAQTRPLLENATVISEVLPTEFRAGGNKMRVLIQTIRPHIVLILGVAPGMSGIRLERVALNIDDTEAPDNAGESPKGELIVRDGPLAYFSTLQLPGLLSVFERRGVPVAISNHAGTYVCNHVFYVARHELERLALEAVCGLVHIPLISELAEASDASMPALPLAAVIDSMTSCIQKLADGSYTRSAVGDVAAKIPA